MASSLIFNPNTYAGEEASGYISQALLGARSLDRGLLTLIPNVRKKATIRGLEQDVVFQDPSCAFSPEGNTTLDERYLSPVSLSVMYELCFKDLYQSWEAAQLSGGNGKGDIPEDLGQFLISRMQEKINIGIERLIWQGKSGSDFSFSASFPGLLAKMETASPVVKLGATIGQLSITGITKANPAVVTVASTANLQTGDKVTLRNVGGMTDVNGQTYTITVLSATTFSLGVNSSSFGTYTSGGVVQFINQSNVIEVLTALYNATPEAVKRRDDFRILVPGHVADAYRFRQATAANGAGTYFTTDKPLNFLGKPMEEMPWFAPNTLVATRISNLFFGTDLLSDFNEIQVVDMRQTTADQKIRYRANFSVDVEFGYGQDVVLYRPA